MLPINILKSAIGEIILVELKNGDTYNGTLTNSDTYMNLNLTDVVLTLHDGQNFFKLQECYVRGYAIKYLRLNSSLIDNAVSNSGTSNQQHKPAQSTRGSSRGRGNFRGRNRGRARNT